VSAAVVDSPLLFKSQNQRHQMSYIAKTKPNDARLRMKTGREQGKLQSLRIFSPTNTHYLDNGSVMKDDALRILYSAWAEVFVVEGFYGHMSVTVLRAKAHVYDISVATSFGFLPGVSRKEADIRIKWRIAFQIANERLKRNTTVLYEMSYDLAALWCFRLSNTPGPVSDLEIARGIRLWEILKDPRPEALAMWHNSLLQDSSFRA
jgi:hypothetical protein